MLGFLVLVFIYLFLLLARNTDKPARPSLVRSLVLAAVFIGVISLFSVVTFGVLFMLLLFLPFFFFPSKRPAQRFHTKQEDLFKDFFEQMRQQQQRYQHQQHDQGAHQEHTYHRPASKGMSIHEASKLLGVHIDASAAQIKSAYRKLMLKHHPDKGGSAEFAAKLNTARDVLMARFEKNK